MKTHDIWSLALMFNAAAWCGVAYAAQDVQVVNNAAVIFGGVSLLGAAGIKVTGDFLNLERD